MGEHDNSTIGRETTSGVKGEIFNKYEAEFAGGVGGVE